MSAATMVRSPHAVVQKVAGVAGIVALSAALYVIAFGVIATSGVYGSRMAWLLGVALPLLAISALMSWSARPPAAPPSSRRRVNRALLMTAVTLFAVPIALAVILLGVYALLFAVHGVSLLF